MSQNICRKLIILTKERFCKKVVGRFMTIAIFSTYGKHVRYRWFKVVRFGGGGLVGR